MKYLEKFGFSTESIEKFHEEISANMIQILEDNKKLVQANLAYLLELGIKNLQEIFINYYELFLMDNSNFIEIFNKYDREDLIAKLEKNVAIIEYL